MLRPEGRVLLCLNAPQLSPAFLMDQMREAAPELLKMILSSGPNCRASAFAARSSPGWLNAGNGPFRNAAVQASTTFG